ncbi:MAG: thioredoxin [Candidatus Saccharibacteria bacterium]
MSVIKLDKDNFESEVLNSDKPVLVDFWAAWCGPCKAIGPVVEELAQTLGDKIKVGKLNVDENRDIAMNYGVMSIPTLAIFKGGNEAQRTVGFQGKQQLERFVESNL